MTSSRFPFDTQACSILLFIAEYDENEVSWKKEGWVVDIEFTKDASATWIRGENITEVSTHRENKYRNGIIVTQSKSLLKFTVLLKRNPKTAITYVILPTIVIAIFNIISGLLPTSDGKLIR